MEIYQWVIVVMLLMLVVAIGVGVYTGRVEVRPFRTSAIAMGMMLLAALWMALNHDFRLAALLTEREQQLINAVVDITVLLVAVTGFVTSITKLSDDGGESDTIKAIRELVPLLKKQQE